MVKNWKERKRERDSVCLFQDHLQEEKQKLFCKTITQIPKTMIIKSGQKVGFQNALQRTSKSFAKAIYNGRAM